MKRLIGLLITPVIFLIAGSFADNIRCMERITNACHKHDVYAGAFFGGADIDGFHISLTQIQKDSLKVLADKQLEIIRTNADSLTYYAQ